MEPITIRWETGRMIINPDAFFPTSTARIRKLLRVVALDFERRDDIRTQLAQCCEERAQAIMDGRKTLTKEAVNHHQRAADLQPEIDRLELRISSFQACLKELPREARGLGIPERIKAEKEEVKKLKAKQRGERAAFERKKRELAQGEALALKLRKNAEVLTNDK